MNDQGTATSAWIEKEAEAMGGTGWWTLAWTFSASGALTVNEGG
jgi:hypothetical protein